MAEVTQTILTREEIESEINAFKLDFERNKGKFERYDDFIRGKLEEWKNMTVNIAVIGELKDGKSTLINQLRDVSDGSPGAARVNHTEVMHLLTGEPYPDPNNPHLVYFDFPGYNCLLAAERDTSTSIPEGIGSYLNSIQSENYSIFILVTSHRFSGNHGLLVKELVARKIKINVIRTKMYLEYVNEAGSQRIDVNNLTEATKHRIQSDIRKEIINKLKNDFQVEEISILYF